MKLILSAFGIFIIAVLMNSCSYRYIRAFPSYSGLVAYYPLNGNSLDISGNNNHGVVNGAIPTNNRNGIMNSAYSFDGEDDEIFLGNSNVFNINKELTIYLEFKVENAANMPTFSPLIYKGWINGSREVFNGYERTYSVWFENTGIIHASSADHLGAQHLNTPANTIKTNIWYKLVVVFDRNSGRIRTYVDGNLIAEGSLRTTESVTSKSPLLIGASMEKYKNFSNFHGAIDNIVLFNKALSEDEIKNLFNLF